MNRVSCKKEHTIPQSKPCLHSNGEHMLFSMPVPGNRFVMQPPEPPTAHLALRRTDLFPYASLLSCMLPTAKWRTLPSPLPSNSERLQGRRWKANTTRNATLPSLLSKPWSSPKPSLWCSFVMHKTKRL